MRPRAVIAGVIVVAFLAALTFASSPRLHERLHPAGAQHECAATMIAAGNCEHSMPPASAPEVNNIALSALLPRELLLVSAPVPSSILEHAPPALI
jgi:hypothetical protein